MKKVFLIVFLILTFSMISCAQIAKKQADIVFAEIPMEQRSKLVERLNIFIEFETTDKFNESYKMIAESYKKRIEGGFDRKDYETSPKIKRFLPQSLTVISENTIYSAVPTKSDIPTVFITGCGEFKTDSGKFETMIEAYWENNDWYFSGIQLINHHPRNCKYKTKKKK